MGVAATEVPVTQALPRLPRSERIQSALPPRKLCEQDKRFVNANASLGQNRLHVEPVQCMANGPRLSIDLRNLLAHGPVVVSRRLSRLPFREHVGAHLLLAAQEPILLILQPPQILVSTSRCEFHATTSSSRRLFDGNHHTRCEQSHSTVPLVRFKIDTFGLCGIVYESTEVLRKGQQVYVLSIRSELVRMIVQVVHCL